MKMILITLFVSLSAFAQDEIVPCRPHTVGQTCYVGNGQKEITGQCVWLQNHFLPSCLIVNCGEAPERTLHLNCQKNESEGGICQWRDDEELPVCESY